MTRRAAIIMRGYISGLWKTGSLPRNLLILKKKPAISRHLTGDVSPVSHAS